MNWDEITNQRDAAGCLTDLALAVDALEDHGCDCGTDEPGTCLACLCEWALRGLWEDVERLRKALEPFVNACVGSWGKWRQPEPSDFECGFIVPIHVWTEARKALEGKK